MKKILTLSFIAVLLFSCTKDNDKTESIVQPNPINSTEVNLAIGIKKDADLNLVLNTINGLNFDIRQMNGFFYNSNTWFRVRQGPKLKVRLQKEQWIKLKFSF